MLVATDPLQEVILLARSVAACIIATKTVFVLKCSVHAMQLCTYVLQWPSHDLYSHRSPKEGKSVNRVSENMEEEEEDLDVLGGFYGGNTGGHSTDGGTKAEFK